MARRNPERDILVAARDHGQIGVSDGAHSKASEQLISLYPEDSRRHDSELGVCLDFLVESRHLWPIYGPDGRPQQAAARGLTPKGAQRLYELEHPVRAWSKVNWFPLAVAAATNIIAITSVVVRFWT